MNFEEAFKHCQEGTATEEERNYVKAQLDAANSFLDNQTKVIDAPIKEAEKKDVKKFKKRLKKLVLTPVLIVLGLVIIAGSALAGVFGYSASCAKQKVVYDKFACVDIAMNEAVEWIKSKAPEGSDHIDDTMFRIEDVDRRFIFDKRNLEGSYYVYQVEIEYGEIDFDIEIDTRTGKVRYLGGDGIGLFY